MTDAQSLPYTRSGLLKDVLPSFPEWQWEVQQRGGVPCGGCGQWVYLEESVVGVHRKEPGALGEILHQACAPEALR